MLGLLESTGGGVSSPTLSQSKENSQRDCFLTNLSTDSAARAPRQASWINKGWNNVILHLIIIIYYCIAFLTELSGCQSELLVTIIAKELTFPSHTC